MHMTRAQWRAIAAQATALAEANHVVGAIMLLTVQTGCDIRAGYYAVQLLLMVKARTGGARVGPSAAELRQILGGT